MKGFTFFENFFDSISDERNGLTAAQEGEVYRAILYYVFRGEELPLEGVCRMAFNLIRPSLDISRVRSAARRSAEKSAELSDENQSENKAEESDGKGETNENQSEIKTQSNEHQTQIKSEILTFLEETETETTRKKVSNKKTSSAHARAREGDDAFEKNYVSHADIMDRFGVTGMYREIVEEYLRACYLNGHIVPNNVLSDILKRLDTHYGADEEAKVLSIRKAINGGYYDIAELRDAPELWR